LVGLPAGGRADPGGGRYWHVGTIRDTICNDAYRAHARDELERAAESGNLSSKVLVGLDRNRCYEIVRYSRTRWVRTPNGEKAVHITLNKREDCTVVPDPGIPREWVDAARGPIKGNAGPSRAAGRSLELKGILFCPVDCRMNPYNSHRDGKRYHYYACGRCRRECPSACEHHKD
jgi:hypothetical protein